MEDEFGMGDCVTSEIISLGLCSYVCLCVCVLRRAFLGSCH